MNHAHVVAGMCSLPSPIWLSPSTAARLRCARCPRWPQVLQTEFQASDFNERTQARLSGATGWYFGYEKLAGYVNVGRSLVVGVGGWAGVGWNRARRERV